MKFRVISNNEEINCDVVLTFHDDSNDINYIVYTDGTKNEFGEEELYSSRYVEEDGNYILHDIENDYEWNLIDNMLLAKFNELGD